MAYGWYVFSTADITAGKSEYANAGAAGPDEKWCSGTAGHFVRENAWERWKKAETA